MFAFKIIEIVKMV